MITLIVFVIVWVICGGTSDTVKNFTEQQAAIAYVIGVASDLSLICRLLESRKK